ncbi:hypothetical protein ACS0TY_025642 [Phlomoides rotata]
MAILSPVPTLQDLKVTFQECTLVIPSQETKKQSIFLSNIDQILNYSIPTAFFFKANADFPPENVARRMKTALEKVLVSYDFMAGRLSLNHQTGRLEIDCNAAGAGFVVASSKLSLVEMGDCLVYPNLGYRQLAVERLDNLAHDQPLCVFQITSFKCGGFSIGMSINHILFDGLAAKTFTENLASQAFDDKPLVVVPCTNRHLLAARSPPLVAFHHHEYLDLNLPVGEGSRPPVFDCLREELEVRIFKLSPNDLTNLKNKAKTITTTHVSSFAVVAGLIWRCKALSGDVQNTCSTLLYAVNIRPRVVPPLPPSFSGNGVLPFRVSANFEELESGPFSKVVDIISEGAKEMTDEYVKSAFDWLEMHRGIPHGDYLVTSWLRLGFDEVVYPWGKPIFCCPVANHRKDICWVFADAIDGGVGAMVALPAKEMEKFEALFLRLSA